MKSFETLKKKMHQLNYGREIIMDVVRDYAIGLEKSNVDILDIGAGPGIDLLNCRATLEKINMTANMYGIEN